MNTGDLRVRTLAAVRAHPSPTRHAFRLRALLVVASSLAVSLAIFWDAGGLRAAPRPDSLLVGTFLGALAIATVVVAVGIHRGRSMLPRPAWQLGLLIVLAPAALFAWKILWSARYPGMMVDWPERPGLRCFFLTLAIGVGPMAAFVALSRNSEPVRPGLVGGAIGIGVGAMTWVALELWCPVAYPRHLVIGHATPALVLAALGAVLGRRVMKMRG
jgi:hypothetical protein